MSTWTIRKTSYGEVTSGPTGSGPVETEEGWDNHEGDFWDIWFTHTREHAPGLFLDFTVNRRNGRITCTIDGSAISWDTIEECLQTLRGDDVPEAILEFGVAPYQIADDLAAALQGQTQTSWSA